MKNNSKINYIVDILMFVCFLVSAVSGVLLLFSPKDRELVGMRLEVLTKDIKRRS
jgi:hypothetical protein